MDLSFVRKHNDGQRRRNAINACGRAGEDG